MYGYTDHFTPIIIRSQPRRKLSKKAAAWLYENADALYPNRERYDFTDFNDFDKSFFVYGNDETDVRQTLHHSFIQLLLDIQTTWGEVIELSFVRKNIYIALKANKVHLLELGIDESLKKRKRIQELADELAFCVRLGEKMINIQQRD
jgi:hypothetical protein